MRKQRNLTKQILKLLRKNDRMLSTNEFHKYLDVDYQTVLQNLTELLSLGLVERNVLSNGIYWKLKDGDQQ